MLNILLVGCGNIGSRHLQSLLKSKNQSIISVIDPILKNIENEIDNYSQSNDDKLHQINRYENLTNLPAIIDILIIATNSNIRIDIIKKIFLTRNPKYTILEKFLFQNREDFYTAKDIFFKKNSRVWVNQPILHQKSYQEIASYFKNSQKLSMTVSGGNWGLCCNSVHYIELFDHLTRRQSKIHVSKTKFKKILKSKRPGFYEIIGKIELKTNNQSNLILETNDKNHDPACFMNIDDGQNKVKIKFIDNKIYCDFLIEEKKISKNYVNLYQSEMTAEVVNSLIKNSKCSLPTYLTSMKQHLTLIDSFKDFFIKNNVITEEEVPIT